MLEVGDQGLSICLARHSSEWDAHAREPFLRIAQPQVQLVARPDKGLSLEHGRIAVAGHTRDCASDNVFEVRACLRASGWFDRVASIALEE